jgi:CRP/FNR family transcriptional regulator, cyclic AMP receptor protein
MNIFVGERPALGHSVVSRPVVPVGRGHARLGDADNANLLASGWFGRLPQPVQAAIFASAQVRQVPAGAMLAQRGGAPFHWIGVVRGALRLGTALSDGRNLTLDFVGPGQWFGDVALTDGLPLDLDVQTHVQSTLLLIPKEGLRALVDRHGELGDALLQLNCQRLRHMFKRFEELHTLSLPQRLARQVLRLMRQFGRPVAEGVRIELGLSQGDLASMACGSRQRVNRSLRQLQCQGILQLGNARMVVLDAERLDAVAGGRLALVDFVPGPAASAD